MKKIALITGISGQDGAYLSEFLISKNYKVIGTVKNKSKKYLWRIDKLGIRKKLIILKLNICDEVAIRKILNKYKVDEFYNLAAQSYVSKSFNNPIKTSEVNSIAVIKILENVRKLKNKLKFYQASSSEMYGGSKKYRLDELSKFNPQSPYAISKLFSHYIISYYRKTYNLYAVSGILFNHDSPLRDENFVTKKIIKGLIDIMNKKKKFIELGNISAKRDWGYAKEFVEQIWKMMQLKNPQDFVIATGKSYSIKEFIDIATEYLKINTKWIGKKSNLKLVNVKTKKIIIKINKKYFRPAEVEYTRGGIYKAKKLLNWKPKTDLKKLVKIMIDFRSNNIESFDNLEINSIDFYASVKSLYLQDRENKISNVRKGNIEIFYKNEEDWEEIDNN